MERTIGQSAPKEDEHRHRNKRCNQEVHFENPTFSEDTFQMDKLFITAGTVRFPAVHSKPVARCAIGKTCSVGVIFPSRRGGSNGELQRLNRSL